MQHTHEHRKRKENRRCMTMNMDMRKGEKERWLARVGVQRMKRFKTCSEEWEGGQRRKKGRRKKQNNIPTPIKGSWERLD